MSFESIDIDILRTINVDRFTQLDDFFRFLSNTAPYISGIIPLAFILFGLFRKRNDIRRTGLQIASSYLLSVVVSNVLKYIVDRPRPFVTYSFIQKLSYGGSGSFPSGHTSDVFVMATAVSILFPRWFIIVPIYCWAIFVAYSRMDLGVHYPSDVLAGVIVGAGSAILCNILFNRKSKQQSD
ncbi:MAG TPA: phosphatase PAP2 family protein [Candidatus Kapabacteria bacterium]|nr:phosphatase PAP2 family protein [Candidatus Kapabacteria bacterium]